MTVAPNRNSRFLATVLNGLMTQRALPADAVQVETETETLRIAVHAVTTALPQAEGLAVEP